MKVYQIWGNLSADEMDDIYPSVNVCDQCIEEEEKRETEYRDRKNKLGDDYEEEFEETFVQCVSEYDSMYGETCHFCGKSKSEEDKEKIIFEFQKLIQMVNNVQHNRPNIEERFPINNTYSESEIGKYSLEDIYDLEEIDSALSYLYQLTNRI